MKIAEFSLKNYLNSLTRTGRLLSLGLCLSLVPQIVPGQAPAPPVVIEPKAVRILREMTERYSKLTSFKQVTSYSSTTLPMNPEEISDVPMPPAVSANRRNAAQTPELISNEADIDLKREKSLDNSVSLSYKSPNRLRLEFSFLGNKGKTETQSRICDGKILWSFDSEKKLYSKIKAPKYLRDILRVGKQTDGTLELAMLMGIDPFTDTLKNSLGVRCVGREQIADQEADIVSIATRTDKQDVQTRFFIGTESKLLLKMQVETAPLAKRIATIVAVPESVNPLDELKAPLVAPKSDVLEADPEDAVIRNRVIVTFANEVKSSPIFDETFFSFEPPANAFREGNPNEKIDVKSWRRRIEELAKKNRKERTGRPRVLKF